MSEEQEFPAVGDTVVVKITKVLDYGAFAELQEYDQLKGFVHISQVSSGWIKNIRNYVKEGQVRAAKVQSVDREKNQIDLNLTKVSSSAQRAKINEFKQLKREKKLIENLAKKIKKDFEDAWDAVAEPLIKKHGSLTEAFKEISLNGKQAAEGVEKEWLSALLEMVEKSVTVPSKTVKGDINLRVLKPNGVEIIKQALSQDFSKGAAEISISYLGSGKYLLKATSYDFKISEKEINNVAEKIIGFVESKGGEASFKKED